MRPRLVLLALKALKAHRVPPGLRAQQARRDLLVQLGRRDLLVWLGRRDPLGLKDSRVHRV